MIDIREITVGQAYGCKFRAKNIPLDEWDRPGGMLSLSDVPVKKFGDYESFGFLKQRDTEKELVVVIDEKTNREFVCSYDDIWDVDEVELIEDSE